MNANEFSKLIKASCQSKFIIFQGCLNTENYELKFVGLHYETQYLHLADVDSSRNGLQSKIFEKIARAISECELRTSLKVLKFYYQDGERDELDQIMIKCICMIWIIDNYYFMYTSNIILKQ